jgi:CDP-diacylglycerol--glycerol-3-phosphate 3-phosphatidyltransferase
MTAANMVTIFRIIMIPIFLVILLTEMENKEIIAFVIFVIAAVSDSLDGYLARKYNQVTDLGKFLDPLADKLLVTSGLLALLSLNIVQAWIVTLIIIRELFITAFRFYFLINDSVFSASWVAKRKTFFQVTAISILIIAGQLPNPLFFFRVGHYVLYLALLLTIYSAFEYVLKYTKLEKKDTNGLQ